MNYTYIMNSSMITLVNIGTGSHTTIHRDDQRFETFKTLIKEGRYEEAENLNVKKVLTEVNTDDGSVKVVIADGVGTINVFGNNYKLADAIVNRIMLLKKDGFSVEPMINFVKRLYSNPSKAAIDELFLFLERTNLPITEDGCFIAYKVVANNYLDIYSGTMDNSVGKTVQMPRFSVDDNRNNTCSAGLHFCSKDYLNSYGSSKRDTDRCVLVKIDPADVVSIPSDYNNAKGRTCKYVVVGEVDSGWRTTLETKDYNDKCVVKTVATTSVPKTKTVTLGAYRFDFSCNRWKSSDNKMVSRATVADKNGVTIDKVKALEV